MSSVDSTKQDNGKREQQMWDSTHRISTAHVSGNGDNNISNGKQSYNMNTVTCPNISNGKQSYNMNTVTWNMYCMCNRDMET